MCPILRFRIQYTRENSEDFKKLINEIWVGVIFMLVRKNGGGGVKVEMMKRSYFRLWKEEIESKMFQK